jgi:hypothetical protein
MFRETLVFTKAKRHHLPENILHRYGRENVLLQVDSSRSGTCQNHYSNGKDEPMAS